jgi:hypothetical protein
MVGGDRSAEELLDAGTVEQNSGSLGGLCTERVAQAVILQEPTQGAAATIVKVGLVVVDRNQAVVTDQLQASDFPPAIEAGLPTRAPPISRKPAGEFDADKLPFSLRDDLQTGPPRLSGSVGQLPRKFPLQWEIGIERRKRRDWFLCSNQRESRGS